MKVKVLQNSNFKMLKKPLLYLKRATYLMWQYIKQINKFKNKGQGQAHHSSDFKMC